MFFSLPILSDLSAPSQVVPTEDVKCSNAAWSHFLEQLGTDVFIKLAWKAAGNDPCCVLFPSFFGCVMPHMRPCEYFFWQQVSGSSSE